jgi:uncharacterized RDD family membrane protein YckC
VHCGLASDEAALRPEVVHMAPASTGARATALIIDLLCVFYMLSAFPHALDQLLALFGRHFAVVAQVGATALPLIYFGVWQANGRQTIGQQVVGIAVLRTDRTPLSLRRSLLRALVLMAAIAGTLSGLLGIAASLSPAAAQAVENAGFGGRWLPRTPARQAAHLVLGALFVSTAFTKGRRWLHDMAADSQVYAV